MKNKVLIYFFMVFLFGVSTTSCKKYLDVNQNPNQPVTTTPQLLIPQAITATASQLNGYNNYGAQMGLFMANAGGYGGFGSNVTYNFSVTDYTGLWGVYDVNEDFYQARNLSAGDPTLIYFNAIARIMLAHNFQLLVDTYNSVPYFDALSGNGNTRPKFDDPTLIYADLAKQIDSAILLINQGENATGALVPINVSSGQDPLFGGDMDMWKEFANTLKLRLMVTGNGKVTFANTSFDPVGFLTTDALINPGYARDNGKQNPKWNNWAYSYTGGDANRAWMPSTFILSFYNKKLIDFGRGTAIYYKFPGTPTNKLGYENTSVASSPSGSFWYPSSNRTGNSSGNTTGVLKGPNAGFPVLTAAESYFLQAEAVERGIITSSEDVATLFNDGIQASFHYLYELPDGSLSGDPNADFDSYQQDNNLSYLVNFDLAASQDERLEAILTQKFIALNMVNSNQAWNDYRRTLYPVLVNTAGADGTQTFASTQSQSTRPDRLPTRLAYPSAEISSNPNTPNGINAMSSLIFWAKQ